MVSRSARAVWQGSTMKLGVRLNFVFEVCCYGSEMSCGKICLLAKIIIHVALGGTTMLLSCITTPRIKNFTPRSAEKNTHVALGVASILLCYESESTKVDAFGKPS